MKNIYSFYLKMFSILCLMLLTSTSMYAQWEMLKECKAAQAVYVTKSGNLLMSDYQFDYSGGIYISTDQGNSWTKTDIADHNYNNFIAAGDYIFASGIGAEIARSADEGKTWELVNFSEPLSPFMTPDVLDYDAVYAMAYHNGKLFVGDFNGGGIVYSEDFGETWKLTKRDNLTWEYTDEESGKSENYMDNFYNLVSFKGKLYAFGMMKVYVYDESANDWVVLREDSNFMAVATIFNDKMYCGRSVMNETVESPFLECTVDGENWKEVPRPDGLIDNNIRALSNDGKNIYAGLQSRGIYYTSNEGESWVNISEGLPFYSIQVPDQYLAPLRFAFTDDYAYVIIYDTPFSDRSESGLYRYAKDNLPTGVEEVAAAEQTKVYVDHNNLYVGLATSVAVYDVCGKQCHVTLKNGKVNLGNLNSGCYLYEVTVGSKKLTGKFFKK